MTQIGETPGYGESLESKTLPPPPPEGNLEVVIRTMATDLALVHKSGGATHTSSIATLSIDNTGKVTAAARPFNPNATQEKDRTQIVIWGIVFVVGAVVLFLFGFYFIPFILSKFTSQPATNQITVSTTTQNSNGTSVEPVSFTHASFFTTTPPPIVDITLYENGLPPDHAAFIRNVQSTFTSRPDSIFLEILPHGIGGRSFDWPSFASLLGASDINQTFFNDHLKKDYTIGVLRGAGTAASPALQPVYVFKLKEGENPILLQKDILSIENNPAAFGKLFFSDPGDVVGGGFKDIQMSGQPARSLSFKNGSSTLVYGWFFNSYLIIGTSQASLQRAIERL